MTEQWGVMFGDGSVMHPWNGRTQRQRAEEEQQRLAQTYYPDQFWLCRRADRDSPWGVVGEGLTGSNRAQKG